MPIDKYILPAKKNINVKSSFTIICLTLILYIFLFKDPFSYNYMVEINIQNFIFFPSVICFSVLLILHFFTKEKFSFQVIDLLFSLLLVFGFGVVLFNHPTLNFNNEYFICCLIILMIYFVMRLSYSFTLLFFLPVLISLFFFLELCIGLNQLYINLDASKDLSQYIIGSLQNSGVYSYFLVICLPLVFYTFKILPGSKTIKKTILIITLILIALVLTTSESRTAIITFIAAVIFVLNYIISEKIKKIIFLGKNKLIVGFLLVALVVGSLYYLIRIRPSSFEGRIFIWQTSIHHFSDHLFTGIGLGEFPYYFPKWQIEYFSSHHFPPISYFLNADETHVAFNELLQILIETGLWGFTCFVFLFIYLFNITSDKNKLFVVTLKLTLILILIAGLSSYPLHCNAILFLVAFCITGLLLNGKNYIPPGKKKINRFGIMVFFVTQFFIGLVAYKSINHYSTISKWNSLREDLLIPSSQIRTKYLQLYPFLSSNGKFLLDMGEHLTDLGDMPNAIKVLEKSKKYYISSKTFLANADAYYQSGNIPAAIKNIEDLSNLVPNKFSPRYELAKLYYQSGDSLKGNYTARFILSMPVKKMSTEVSRIKKATRLLLIEATR